MRFLISLLRVIRDVAYLVAGVPAYLVTGKTPPFAYQALIRLFCQTGGNANDVLSSLVSCVARPVKFGAAKGLLGNLGTKEIDDIVWKIKEHGYYVFTRQLPEDVRNRLLQYALTTECLVRVTEDEASQEFQPKRGVYDRPHPRGVRYDFTQQQVIEIPDVQAMLADSSVLSLAQGYLGSRPVADVCSMWWHTAFSNQPDAKAAQFFHFDMDRIKWLKFFIYLTDVGPDNGPHCFVAGSHRTQGIAPDILSKGYVRLTDEEVAEHYPSSRMVEFTAPSGTIIIEDTRGLHKGKAVWRGDRLMLQIQFSNSLFGGVYPPSRFRSMIPGLKEMVRTYPKIYKNYLGPANV